MFHVKFRSLTTKPAHFLSLTEEALKNHRFFHCRKIVGIVGPHIAPWGRSVMLHFQILPRTFAQIIRLTYFSKSCCFHCHFVHMIVT